MGATLWEPRLLAAATSSASVARWSIFLPPLLKIFTNIVNAKAVGRKALGAHKRYSLGHKADGSSIFSQELHFLLKGISGLWASYPRDPKRPVCRLSLVFRGATGASGAGVFLQCRQLGAKRVPLSSRGKAPKHHLSAGHHHPELATGEEGGETTLKRVCFGEGRRELGERNNSFASRGV